MTAFATSTILALLGVIAFFTYPVNYKPPSGSQAVAVHSLNVVTGRATHHYDRRQQEYLTTRFDLDADFSKLFNWNTKQVFVSLAAEYASAKHVRRHAHSVCPMAWSTVQSMADTLDLPLSPSLQPHNQVVIWDHIILNKADAHIKTTGNVNKYGFREVSRSFG